MSSKRTEARQEGVQCPPPDLNRLESILEILKSEMFPGNNLPSGRNLDLGESEYVNLKTLMPFPLGPDYNRPGLALVPTVTFVRPGHLPKETLAGGSLGPWDP